MTELEKQLKSLPNAPGVYQFYDKHSEIIYIGKAIDLYKRVNSYFNRNLDSAKTKILVKRISFIKHIVVETETDALLLENNLIKQHQPRYNILLKDGKSYPWICIKKEAFPRVFYTRNMINDGSKYYGPYTSIRMVKTLLELIKSIYPIRTCKHKLTKKNISENKFEVCLEYHIGNCLAPCIGANSEDEYKEYISGINHILRGHISHVIKPLKDKMHAYSADYQFENAQKLKEKIEILENYQSKSTVVSPSLNNIDVYSIYDDKKYAYINFTKIINGSIIQSLSYEVKKKLDESAKEILEYAITDIQTKLANQYIKPDEIIIPFELEFNFKTKKITIPQRGDKLRLLELSEKNAKYFGLDLKKQRSLVDPERRQNRILETAKNDLRLKEIPVHIECFDNSNIQGAYPVAACVVFINGKPSTKDYRHYNVKTVEGPDDFASMTEIVYRRYKRLLEEEKSLPQLIIIDGGKGQLSAAVKSLKKLNLFGDIAIIGIAKRLEEIYFPNDPIPIYIDKNSETLKLIQNARNEAHRFGITFHRKKRGTGMLNSELDQITGIGEKTANLLLRKYKSLNEIKNAPFEDVKKIIGKKRAEILMNYFSKK